MGRRAAPQQPGAGDDVERSHVIDLRAAFYLFNLEERIPSGHLLRGINPVVTRVLADLRENLDPFYSETGRPSIDPELMIRMLLVGYCYGIRFERRLCEEVGLHLAYRWFCRLDLDDKVPDHSTFSVNRHGRFRDSDILRHVFEAGVRACMDAGLVKGEGFAVDASVIEANASRYHGKAPDEIVWAEPERQTRAVRGDQISHYLTSATIGHMNHVDTGHHLEQLAGHMGRAPDAGRPHADFGRIGLGIGDELKNRLGWNGWIDHHDERAAA